MRIVKLEMRGFKSFADKTEMIFEPGITAVVGPNGCGKSNVSDAISWILGEQSAKHLRGKSMEDVIFNGTVDRKPLGMAEVNLTISNDNGDFGERYKHFTEIMITRRLYRSGESEFFINRIPCRLKDITEIFLDTGLGTKACSIIKQGEVNELLTSQPEQRRRLIEEAAGIEKYQMQKKEVQRKLEKTALNLERIEDIVSEVRKQVNSLKRQAAKTKAFNRLKEAATNLESTLSALEIKKIREEKIPLEGKLKEAENEKAKISAELSTIENNIEELRLSTLSEENFLKDKRNELYGVENDIRNLESRIEIIKNEISHLRDAAELSRKNISIFEAKKEEFEKNLNEITNELKGYEEKIKDSQSRVKQKEEELAHLKSEISSQLNQLNEKKNRLQSFQTEIVTCENFLDEGELRIESIKNKISHLVEDKNEAVDRKQKLEEDIKSVEESIEGAKKKSKELAHKKESILSEIESLKEDAKKEESKLQDIKERLSLLRSEHSSLEKFYKNHEDLSESSRKILSAKEDITMGNGAVECALSEIIEAKPGYEIAIESALKNYIDGILVDSIETAEKSVHYLKQQNGGKCVFLPAKLSSDESNNASDEFLTRDGVLGKASDYVSCDEKYRGIVDFILKDIMIVKDFESALTVHKNNGHKFTLVDLEGDVIVPEGILRGGSANENDGGILLKKRRIKDLAEEIERFSKEENELNEKVANINIRIAELTNEVEGIAEAEEEIKNKLANLDKSLAIKVEERNRMQEKIEDIKFEIEQYEYEKNEIVEKTENLKEKIDSLKSESAKVESEIESLKEKMGGTEKILEKTQTELTDCKVGYTRTIEEEKRLRFQIENYEDSIKELISKTENEKNSVEESSKRLSQKEEE
ncbi:MAG: chromosome segregation protein SMC, partial [Candidatus Schekmanbacteria bacterium]